MEARRLYRSEQDRMIGGVCAGLGEYLGIDATVVRVVFVVLGFFSVGIVLYLAMWIIVPSGSRLDAPAQEIARDGIADIRERAQRGAREAREAVDRLRGRGEQLGARPVPDPGPPPGAPPEPEASGPDVTGSGADEPRPDVAGSGADEPRPDVTGSEADEPRPDVAGSEAEDGGRSGGAAS